MKDNYYFDNAATSWPKPEAVYQFMDEFSRNNAVNPGRAGYSLGVETQMMIEQTRRLLAEFFNFQGSHNRVVFSQNATDSMNQLLLGVLQDGDHAITTVAEHNCVLRPLNHLERDNNVTTTYLDVDGSGYISPTQIEDAITSTTKMVIINHGSNVLGSVQNIVAIGEITKRRNVVFVVDSAQTAGVLPIDMQGANIDVLVFTGHKGLFGPMGIGGMIVAEQIEISPMRFGGTGINSSDRFQPREYPYALEAGTLAVPAIAGLNAAQHWFADLGTQQTDTDTNNHRDLCVAALAKIHTQENKRLLKITEAMSTLDRFKVLGPSNNDEPRVATASFTVEGLSSSTVGEILDADHHICVRTGLHCAPLLHQKLDTLTSEGAVRIAPGYFTEDGDVDHLILALETLSKR